MSWIAWTFVIVGAIVIVIAVLAYLTVTRDI